MAITTRVPSFAGAHFGEDGELVVRVTDVADGQRALAEMHQLLLDRIRVDPNKTSDERKREMVLPRAWRVVKASHSYAELFPVRSELLLSAFEDDDVISLDPEATHHRWI